MVQSEYTPSSQEPRVRRRINGGETASKKYVWEVTVETDGPNGLWETSNAYILEEYRQLRNKVEGDFKPDLKEGPGENNMDG